MRIAWLAVLSVAAITIAPSAAADVPTIQVRVTSDVSEVELGPGEREIVDLSVTMELKEFSCSEGTQVGVDLVPWSDRQEWFGAEPHPDGDTYATPKETKPTTLTIVVDEDAPGDQDFAFELQPVVKMPAPAECNLVDEPQVDAALFSIRVTTPPSEPPGANGSDAPGNGNDTPAPPAAASILLLCVGVWLWKRRRS